MVYNVSTQTQSNLTNKDPSSINNGHCLANLLITKIVSENLLHLSNLNKLLMLYR